MFETIINLCHAAFEARTDVEVGPFYDNKFTVTVNGDRYCIELDEFDVDDDDEEGEQKPFSDHQGEYKAPERIEDHAGILDVCLHALKGDPIAQKITDLTTDGDNSDCEAIFNTPEGYLILRVR